MGDLDPRTASGVMKNAHPCLGCAILHAVNSLRSALIFPTAITIVIAGLDPGTERAIACHHFGLGRHHELGGLLVRFGA